MPAEKKQYSWHQNTNNALKKGHLNELISSLNNLYFTWSVIQYPEVDTDSISPTRKYEEKQFQKIAETLPLSELWCWTWTTQAACGNIIKAPKKYFYDESYESNVHSPCALFCCWFIPVPTWAHTHKIKKNIFAYLYDITDYCCIVPLTLLLIFMT